MVLERETGMVKVLEIESVLEMVLVLGAIFSLCLLPM
jgi:hypothetical protein